MFGLFGKPASIPLENFKGKWIADGWFTDQRLKLKRFDPATPSHIHLEIFEFIPGGRILHHVHGHILSSVGQLFLKNGTWHVHGNVLRLVVHGGHRATDAFSCDVEYAIEHVYEHEISLRLRKTHHASVDKF